MNIVSPRIEKPFIRYKSVTSNSMGMPSFVLLIHISFMSNVDSYVYLDEVELSICYAMCLF